MAEDGKHSSNDAPPRPKNAAVTAEFNYMDDWEDLDGPESSEPDQNGSMLDSAEPESPAESSLAANLPEPPKQAEPAAPADQGGRITRALKDFDSFLDQNDDDDAHPDRPTPALKRSEANASHDAFGPAGGFDQPQVSGVFSRYDEETTDSSADEFDLFEDDSDDAPSERTLQDIVNAHEKQIHRLEKRLAYQKGVIQVVSELLVEARVISKRELKKRLRALRNKK